MAELVLPLLVDKLTSTHVPAKMEALATLQLAPRCVRQHAFYRKAKGSTSSCPLIGFLPPLTTHTNLLTHTGPTASPRCGATSPA